MIEDAAPKAVWRVRRGSPWRDLPGGVRAGNNSTRRVGWRKFEGSGVGPGFARLIVDGAIVLGRGHALRT